MQRKIPLARWDGLSEIFAGWMPNQPTVSTHCRHEVRKLYR